MDADGNDQRQVTTELASVSSPLWSPDGRYVLLTGSEHDGDAKMRLWVHEVASGLTAALGDENIEAVAGQSTFWSEDGSRVIALLAVRGRQHVVSVGVPDGNRSALIEGDRQISLVSRAAGYLAFVSEHPESPNDLWCKRDQENTEIRLTDFNGWWQDRTAPQREVCRFDVPDGVGGREEIDGWPFRPAATSGPTPLLVDVHGGPASYTLLDFDMHAYWYVLLSRGWSVLSLNTVGSSSYGEKFSTRLREHWGECDLDQQLAAIEGLREQGVTDSRVCVIGKSYGGFLSAWAACRSNAFRAAVVCAPVTSLENHFGVSDSGYYADTYSMYGEPAVKRDTMRRLSPMDYVEDIRTPTDTAGD